MKPPPTASEITHALYGTATTWRLGGWEDFAISPYVPSFDEDGREDPFQWFTIQLGGQVFDIKVRQEVTPPHEARRTTAIERAAYNLVFAANAPIKGNPRSLVDRALLDDLRQVLMSRGYRS